MERIRILSDYTSASEPNILTVVYDDQGDVHIGIFESKSEPEDRGVRLAASGTRHHSPRIQKAFWELLQAYKEELQSPDCHPDLQKVNGINPLDRPE